MGKSIEKYKKRETNTGKDAKTEKNTEKDENVDERDLTKVEKNIAEPEEDGESHYAKSENEESNEFDVLCESVAKLPRRFGLAPTWEVEYDGDMAKRTAAREKMFHAIDGMHGPARGWIGCAQFIHWATSHVSGKVAEVTKTAVDFNHVDNYSEKDFLQAVDKAVHDPKSV